MFINNWWSRVHLQHSLDTFYSLVVVGRPWPLGVELSWVSFLSCFELLPSSKVTVEMCWPGQAEGDRRCRSHQLIWCDLRLMLFSPDRALKSMSRVITMQCGIKCILHQRSPLTVSLLKKNFAFGKRPFLNHVHVRCDRRNRTRSDTTLLNPPDYRLL